MPRYPRPVFEAGPSSARGMAARVAAPQPQCGPQRASGGVDPGDRARASTHPTPPAGAPPGAPVAVPRM
jgi:hypothetical protein